MIFVRDPGFRLVFVLTFSIKIDVGIPDKKITLVFLFGKLDVSELPNTRNRNILSRFVIFLRPLGTILIKKSRYYTVFSHMSGTSQSWYRNSLRECVKSKAGHVSCTRRFAGGIRLRAYARSRMQKPSYVKRTKVYD